METDQVSAKAGQTVQMHAAQEAASNDCSRDEQAPGQRALDSRRPTSKPERLNPWLGSGCHHTAKAQDAPGAARPSKAALPWLHPPLFAGTGKHIAHRTVRGLAGCGWWLAARGNLCRFGWRMTQDGRSALAHYPAIDWPCPDGRQKFLLGCSAWRASHQ
ncbi:hypothetical protein X797_004730 [Metarhizium robertsii]|uniref:Uncharacterized protein n=1 Tax=Metarhizium robertsii TaxID=568076 RepID=A0A0A1UX11_9HYPO|nr:hypothetical protein X797_004730 [Metarhizium robertsii]